MKTISLALSGLLIAAVSVLASEPEVYRPGKDVSLPTVIKAVKPYYPRDAQIAGIQGSVVVGAVVLEDGTVGEATVIRSLDTEYGLDEEAVKAAKAWLFNPGKKNGKPVRVAVTIQIAFKLGRSDTH